MIHLGKNTKSKIISKGISAGRADNTYRGLAGIIKKQLTQETILCVTLLMGNKMWGSYCALYKK